jgi:hypothetical protein
MIKSLPIPARVVKTTARPLSDRAVEIHNAIKELLNHSDPNACYEVAGVYTDTDAQTVRAAKEGAKRPPLTEKEIKIRSIGTITGRLLSKFGDDYKARAVDAGNGAVNIWVIRKPADATA